MPELSGLRPTTDGYPPPMRMRRALFAALGAALVMAACASGEDGVGDGNRVRNDDGDGAERPLPVTDLPTMCEGLVNVPAEGEAQITFVKGELVFGASPEGAGAHCIAGVAGTNPIAWGPRADFFIDIGFSASEVISAEDRVTISGPGDSPRFQTLSRPRGAYGLFIERDGTSLAKVPTGGGKLEDISFLRRHDEATYHPSGRQLAVLGSSQEDVYAMWLVTSAGREPHVIVPSRDEDEFYGMSFSADGSTLYFVEDHHTKFQLFAIDLATFEEGIALPKSELLLEHKQPIIAMASPFTDDLLAYRVGSCDAGFETFVGEGSPADRKVGGDLGDTQPIGWLPDERLLLASTDDLCNPQRALDLHVVDGSRTTLLVEDVTHAAIRAVLPEAEAPVSGPTAQGE